MSVYIAARLRKLVRARARGCCEYCRIHEDDAVLPHVPDHVIALKHGGETEADNLALACHVCNNLKGSDIASIDRSTGKVVRLFNPRDDDWAMHFRFNRGQLVPRSAIGRVTAFLLQFNRPENVEMRQWLAELGLYPRS